MIYIYRAFVSGHSRNHSHPDDSDNTMKFMVLGLDPWPGQVEIECSVLPSTRSQRFQHHRPQLEAGSQPRRTAATYIYNFAPYSFALTWSLQLSDWRINVNGVLRGSLLQRKLEETFKFMCYGCGIALCDETHHWTLGHKWRIRLETWCTDKKVFSCHLCDHNKLNHQTEVHTEFKPCDACDYKIVDIVTL